MNSARAVLAAAGQCCLENFFHGSARYAPVPELDGVAEFGNAEDKVQYTRGPVLIAPGRINNTPER